jgi:large subunit ribosomal protein L15
MQLHNVKRKTKNKTSIKVGRGGKRGKTAGRGTKGQNARAGRKKRPELRDIIKKLPKLRGRGKNSFISFYTQPEIINLEDIELNFSAGDIVSPSTIVKKGLLTLYKGRNPEVKLLSTGELSKKLTIKGCTVSAGVKEKIEKAGGTVR